MMPRMMTVLYRARDGAIRRYECLVPPCAEAEELRAAVVGLYQERRDVASVVTVQRGWSAGG